MKVDFRKVKSICRKYDLRFAVLFGSEASGKAHSRSDVDIAVLTRDEKSFNQLELIADFMRCFQKDQVDVVIINHADPLLVYEVVRQGVLLYEEKKGLYSEFKIKGLHQYYDTEKFRVLEDRYLRKYVRRTL